MDNPDWNGAARLVQMQLKELIHEKFLEEVVIEVSEPDAKRHKHETEAEVARESNATPTAPAQSMQVDGGGEEQKSDGNK